MYKKRVGLLLTFFMVLGMAGTASAVTKITDIPVKISYDSEPASGETIGSVSATTTSNLFTIDAAEYLTNQDTWMLGDRPIVQVEMTARDGYKFSSTSKGTFDISGSGATYKRAKAYDDGATLVLEVYLKTISGKLSEVLNPEWSGTTAVWEPMDGAKSYEIKLLRDEKTVTTVKTTNTYYDFSGNFGREGYYTFTVRAIASYNDRAGEWSVASDDYYVDESSAWTDPNSGSGHWVSDQFGWWYSLDRGGYPSNTWRQINQVWYYFNPSGYMVTGWQFINNSWYFFNPSGAMVTGWQLINNHWYYFDGGGTMTTGWQYVGGKWYYMDASGIMYANTRTPDGYYVDSSGARIY